MNYTSQQKVDSWYDETGIGEYISAISNVAAMQGKDFGYLIWGIHDETHEYTNTTFSYRKNVKGEPLEHFLARQITPDIGFSFNDIEVVQIVA